jgi:hypothetical protein
MTAQYQVDIAPKLAALPPAMAAGLAKIAEKPSDLVQVLLQKQLQEMIPQAIRPAVIDGIKDMMARSIHPVFWIGLSLITCGIFIAQFLGNESLTNQLKKQPKTETGAATETEPAWSAH